MPRIVSLTLLDCCLSDYFQGCSKPVYSVPVDGDTTAEELRDSLLSEYNGGCDDGVPDDLAGFTAALDSMFADCKPDQVIFPDLESREETADSMESVYAYFRVDIEFSEAEQAAQAEED